MMDRTRHNNIRHQICSDLDSTPSIPAIDYFVVMEDHGSLGMEAVVDPALTLVDVVELIRSNQYGAIAWIHHIHDGVCDDVTNAMLKESGFYDTPEPEIDRQTAARDHAQDHGKNWKD
jgi:hypothetical protein